MTDRSKETMDFITEDVAAQDRAMPQARPDIPREKIQDLRDLLAFKYDEVTTEMQRYERPYFLQGKRLGLLCSLSRLDTILKEHGE